MYKKIFFTVFFLFAGFFLNSGLSAEKESDDVKAVTDDAKSVLDDIIVEKNLFHPERKKWVMKQKKEKKSGKPKTKKPVISKIELFGTIIEGDKSYAVLRTKKRRKKGGDNKLYMVGDYISGYYIKEIDRKKVVLKDETANEDFEIFINEGKKNRIAAKTEVREEAPQRIGKQARKAGGSTGKKQKVKSGKKAPNPKKAKTAEFLKKRLKKHAKILKTKKSKLVRKQADKDYKKIEELLPYMSPSDRREVLELKRELDSLGQ